jgi:hypothetical protein
MHRRLVVGLSTVAIAGGVLLSAQEGGQLPSQPQRPFGGSVTGAYDGWFDNADGTHSFLVGYYNRNTAEALDIPIGPDNRIEPGGPDMGQPTHFLPGRNVGVFVVTVPKEFTPQQKLTWTIVANGQTTRIPLHTKLDYIISPFGEDAHVGNKPPVIRFEEAGPTIAGPTAAPPRAIARTTSVGTPLSLTIWADDDAKYSSGTNAPMRNPPPPVAVHWAKYRGTGDVAFAANAPAVEVLKGGAVAEPFSGRATTTATFSAPGEYTLHATVSDFSGLGGRGEVCCWTNAVVKVTVTP